MVPCWGKGFRETKGGKEATEVSRNAKSGQLKVATLGKDVKL